MNFYFKEYKNFKQYDLSDYIKNFEGSKAKISRPAIIKFIVYHFGLISEYLSYFVYFKSENRFENCLLDNLEFLIKQ